MTIESMTVNGTKYSASGDIDMLSGTVNTFYDVKTGTGLPPYVGAGLGVVHMEISKTQAAGISVGDDSPGEFMMLGEVGITYDVPPKDAIDDSASHTVKTVGRHTF